MSAEIHFDHPPLDEVVCGVHFAGVKWSDIHFGLYYTELGGRYPHTQRRPPVSLFESRGSEGLQIELMTEPQLPLLWYESPDSPFLLQVQKDAFFVNWRRQSGTFTYPHFQPEKGESRGSGTVLSSEWETFRTFCDKQAIGTPEVLTCHLAYDQSYGARGDMECSYRSRPMVPPPGRDEKAQSGAYPQYDRCLPNSKTSPAYTMFVLLSVSAIRRSSSSSSSSLPQSCLLMAIFRHGLTRRIRRSAMNSTTKLRRKRISNGDCPMASGLLQHADSLVQEAIGEEHYWARATTWYIRGRRDDRGRLCSRI